MVNQEELDEEAFKAEQLKRKRRIAKLRLAAIGVNFGKPERKEVIDKSKGTQQFKETKKLDKNPFGNQDRVDAEVNFINTGDKIRPPVGKIDSKLRRRLAAIDTGEVTRENTASFMIRDKKEGQTKRNRADEGNALRKSFSTKKPLNPKVFGGDKINSNLKRKLAQHTAKEHGHSIVFRGHLKGKFRGASLQTQDKNYAKYFLLNAKQINGNGWGISQETAKQNMGKFIGRPLVITSSLWHGASLYGESYEHPYLPTNDLNQIFAHQEPFRVGNIIGIDESKNGDFHAVVEMLPKFAGRRLPPFCSPAIFQLDAMEKEGNISKWEALHLAALDSDPAYGARVAILKGTCIGTENACTVQFKSAKLVGRPGEEKKATVKRKLGELLDGSAIMKDGPEKASFKEKLGKKKPTRKLRPGVRDVDNFIDDKPDRDADESQAVDNDRNFFASTLVCPVNLARLKGRLAGLSTHGQPKQTPPVITALGPRKPFRNSDQKALDKITKPFNQRGINEKDDPKKKQNLEAKLQKLALSPKERIEQNRLDRVFEENKKIVPDKQRPPKPTRVQVRQRIQKEKVVSRENQVKDKLGIGRRFRPGTKPSNVELSSNIRREKEFRDIFGSKGVAGDDGFRGDSNMRRPLDKGELPLSVIERMRKDESIGGSKSKIDPRRSVEDVGIKSQLRNRLNVLRREQLTGKQLVAKSVEDILRGAGRSVDGSHSPSTFLSSKGEFIGSKDTHTNQILQLTDKNARGIDDDKLISQFSKKNSLPKVQTFPINRAGVKKTSVGISGPINQSQLKSIRDLEIGGQEIGFNVNETIGTGSGNLMKALRRQKLLL